MTAPLGTGFGFEVRSTLPFAYLRGGFGDPLEVTAPAAEGTAPGDELLIEWRSTPELPPEARLYSDGRAFRLWIGGGGWFSVEPKEGRIEVPGDGGLRREERLWAMPALLCFRARGDLPLHAAAVETDGSALLVAAPRTYGKTTMAAAFHSAGHRVLSEDTACLRLAPEPAVVPGPAMLRVRHAVAGSLELPNARRIGEDADRVHYALDERGDCTPVPLRAVVFLERSEGPAELEPVDQPTAIRDLCALSFRLPTDEDIGHSFAGVVALASSVPIFRLRRLLRLEDLTEHVALVLSRA